MSAWYPTSSMIASTRPLVISQSPMPPVASEPPKRSFAAVAAVTRRARSGKSLQPADIVRPAPTSAATINTRADRFSTGAFRADPARVEQVLKVGYLPPSARVKRAAPATPRFRSAAAGR